MRSSVGLSALALAVLAPAVLPVHGQLPTPPSTLAASTPVGQGQDGDWAFIARYRDANRALITNPLPRRVVFMGDSITEGWALQPFIRDNPSFVGRGIAGQTAPQMLVRFRSDVIALKPAIVHVMAGTNDIARNTGPETPGEIEGYVSSMVELALANRIQVVLASIPPAKDFYWHRDLEPAAQIRAMNDWLREYAASHGIGYVDYWSVMATADGAMKPEFSADGVHPNAAGYAAMRPLAEAAIARALRRP
jgi:lysophospholipase L1-like esterase